MRFSVLLRRLIGWPGLGFLLQSKQTKQDLGTCPSFFLRERKYKMSWKAGHAFTAKSMSPAAKESSSEVGFETGPQVSTTANVLGKCEPNIPTMMSAIMEPHGIKVSRYHSSALNWTRTYGKTFDIKTVSSEGFTQVCILSHVYFTWAVADQLTCFRTLASYSRPAPANCWAKAQPWFYFLTQL